MALRVYLHLQEKTLHFIERLTKFSAKLISSRSPGHLPHGQNRVGLAVAPENAGKEYLGNPSQAAGAVCKQWGKLDRNCQFHLLHSRECMVYGWVPKSIEA